MNNHLLSTHMYVCPDKHIKQYTEVPQGGNKLFPVTCKCFNSHIFTKKKKIRERPQQIIIIVKLTAIMIIIIEQVKPTYEWNMFICMFVHMYECVRMYIEVIMMICNGWIFEGSFVEGAQVFGLLLMKVCYY